MDRHVDVRGIGEVGSISLSNSLDEGKKILELLKKQLQSLPQKQVVSTWLQQLNNLSRTSDSRVVIGVVGATGSGKSSIINALLGEKQLIPTNCMRACTAVVTEISYNHHTNGGPWRAHIEFVSRAQWRKELELLLGDVGSALGSVNDDESEAGIAFAKITAVYPFIDKKNIANITLDELMQKREVHTYLGTELEFDASTADGLYTQLKRFIDSKEKLSSQYAASGIAAPTSMDSVEYWPLIQKVCIYGKHSVLQTGCVLVDLPGVADSNPARAAVAKSYLQNCAALWIVAPIIRAPDEKTARYLLGEAFKRQLHRDGTLSRLTFVCSKTDEIVIHEARSVLDHYPEFVETTAAIDAAKAQVMKDLDDLSEAYSEAQKNFNILTYQHTKIYKEEQAYRQLKAMARGEKPVHPPLLTALSPKKRAANTKDEPQTPTKRSKTDQYIARASQPPDNNSEQSMEIGHPTSQEPRAKAPTVVQDTSKPAITLQDIDSRLKELGEGRAVLRKEKEISKGQKDKYRNEIEELKVIEADLTSREWVACALGRNRYSSAAIRDDFAAGLKDLVGGDYEDDDKTVDLESGREQDADQTLAANLPVFCVSSQGYQRIRGQLEGEQSASMFSDEVDTGIPALRQHAFNIGKAQMEAGEEAFLNDAERLLGSLRLWCSGTGDNTNFNNEEDNTELAKQVIDRFIKNIKNNSLLALTSMESIVQMRIFGVFPSASSTARDKALTTVDRWFVWWKAPVNPGLHFQTFRAIVRRDGVYTNRRKSYNVANELLEPLMKHVDSHWGPVFNKVLKSRFRNAKDRCGKEVEQFTECFNKLLKDRGASKNAHAMFGRQIIRFVKSVAHTLLAARSLVEKEQKEANRLFTAGIEAEMNPVYAPLLEEHGFGSFQRMKDTFRDHVEVLKESMFETAADSVENELERIFDGLKKTLSGELDDLCNAFRQDCIHIISVKAQEFAGLDEADQKIVLSALAQAETDLEALALPVVADNVIDPAIQTLAGETFKEQTPLDEATDGIDALGLPEDQMREMEWEDVMEDNDFRYNDF